MYESVVLVIQNCKEVFVNYINASNHFEVGLENTTLGEQLGCLVLNDHESTLHPTKQYKEKMRVISPQFI